MSFEKVGPVVVLRDGPYATSHGTKLFIWIGYAIKYLLWPAGLLIKLYERKQHERSKYCAKSLDEKLYPEGLSLVLERTEKYKPF